MAKPKITEGRITMSQPLLEIYFGTGNLETVGYVTEEVYDQIYPILDKYAKSIDTELQENYVEDFTLSDIRSFRANVSNLALKYEELCELIKGDSPNWTHEEVVERLELAMDSLIKNENT